LLLTIDSHKGRRGANDERLMTRLGELLRRCGGLAGGLIATGGDTAYAILHAWNATALRLIDEVEPGVPLSVTAGPRAVRVVTKAGAFGSPATLVRARARLAELSVAVPGEA
jgi:4-hydroxythreonine-4-phosphate dehydrogenase